MPTPRVFVSSTCYDLKYIRENLRYFIRTVGYEPVLSEDGSVFYNPAQHVEDACVADVSSVQMFVLVIGGRSGSRFHNSDKSITNAEYDAAIEARIPIFALVEDAVASQYDLYARNQENTQVDLSLLNFPSVDSVRVFQFIEAVRRHSVNNAIQPFRDFSDIENYLRKQWAGMMFDFLSRKAEALRVASTLDALTRMNERIELMSKYILDSVADERRQLEAAMYQEILGSAAIRDLSWLGLKISPGLVLQNTSFAACAQAAGKSMQGDPSLGMEIANDGRIGKGRLQLNENDYQALRTRLHNALQKKNKTPEAYIADYLAGQSGR